MVGLYGVISHNVSRRVREIGIRMALGADRHSVLRLLLKQGSAIILAGVAAGCIASALLLRLLADRLYGVNPLDPVVIAGATLIVVSTGLAASLGPALRAVRRDPASVLRIDAP
jgi:putative ABC transport system permease protein